MIDTANMKDVQSLELNKFATESQLNWMAEPGMWLGPTALNDILPRQETRGRLNPFD